MYGYEIIHPLTPYPSYEGKGENGKLKKGTPII